MKRYYDEKNEDVITALNDALRYLEWRIEAECKTQSTGDNCPNLKQPKAPFYNSNTEASMEECCGNCVYYDHDRDVCTYYPYDEFLVHDYDKCQITNSAGCFEALS